MQKKVLKGITTFNDCWFRTCYYHQLMAGLSYFGVPAEYSIFDFTTEFRTGNAKGEYSHRAKNVLDENEFEELTGVCTQKSNAQDVVRFLTQCIERNRPVIVGQDNYYIPYRSEFQNEHGAHFVLVFGYDLGEKTFSLIEHSFASGLDFCPRQVPFDYVAQAYQGFCEHCVHYTWSVEQLLRCENKITFARRRELINKLCEPLHRVQLGDYLQLYEVLRETDVADMARTVDTSIHLARYLRARMLQYEQYGAAKEITAPLEKVWQCAFFMQGVAMKINHLKCTELYRSKAVEDKLRVMKEQAAHFEKAVRHL